MTSVQEEVYSRIADLSQMEEFSTYAGSFEAIPSECDRCSHEYQFVDRVAAAIIQEAHSFGEIVEWLRPPPGRTDELVGMVFCPTCRTCNLAGLRYAYPTFPEMLAVHREKELRTYVEQQGYKRG